MAALPIIGKETVQIKCRYFMYIESTAIYCQNSFKIRSKNSHHSLRTEQKVQAEIKPKPCVASKIT